MKFDVHDESSAPEASRAFFEPVKKKLGMVPNVLKVMAESPELMEAYVTLDGLLQKSSLGKAERNILLLSAARANQCHYCMAAHTAAAQGEGVDPEVIDALRNDRPLEEQALEAFRQFVSEMTETRGLPGDATIKAFLGAGYSQKNALEVILGIGLKTLSNYSNHLADTPLDEAFAPAKWNGSGS